MVSIEIKNYIKDNLPVCDNKVELAYAIYVLLGQILYYSPIYATTKNINTVLDPKEVTLSNPYVICYTWSMIYEELLKDYDINCYIDTRNKEHSLVQIDADGMLITADATKSSSCNVYDISNDLTSIKFGLDINFFNLTPAQENHSEKREVFNQIKNNVNKKLNIDTQAEKEIEEYIKMIDESELDSETRTFLLINMLNTLYKNNAGEVERRQLFDRYYKVIFNDKDMINRQISILYNSNIMAKKLIIVDGEEPIYYIEDQEGFRITSKEEINDLLRKRVIRFKYSKDKEFYVEPSKKNSSLVKKMV